MENKKLFGLVIASALATASLALAEDAKTPADEGADKTNPYFCQNDSCAGHSDSDPKNSCAGKGTLKAANEKACKKAGGKWKKKDS